MVFYAQSTLEERLLKIRQDQGALTELLANSMSIEAESEGEGDDDEGEGEVTATTKRAKKRREASSRKNAGECLSFGRDSSMGLGCDGTLSDSLRSSGLALSSILFSVPYHISTILT